MEEFDITLASQAQKKYCEDHFLPWFAPRTGVCFRCNQNIYSPNIDKVTGQTCGISVQAASSRHITGCPVCHMSFCD